MVKYDYDNCIGEKYNRLTILKEVTKADDKNRKFLCECVCGTIQTKSGVDVFRGHSKSCGCLSREKAIERNKSEEHRNRMIKRNKERKGERRKAIRDKDHAEYNVWSGMKQRCYNPNSAQYLDYGGRGITVCDRWINSFENFLSDMGKKPSYDLSIERVDNDKGYSPDNCIWADRTTQNRNRRERKVGKSGYKYIYKDKYGYKVRIRKEYVGYFKTLSEAIDARDNYMQLE